MISDIVIVGGGVMGLAIAIELKLRGAGVCIISRDVRAAATQAAAGMLAPDAEQIPAGSMRQLCVRSRNLYPEWTSKLEQMTGINPGYWASGIITPLYQEGQPVEGRTWLDKQTIHQYQSGLGADVVGGWWYPEDAQVDNRALLRALLAAAASLGVDIKEGVRVAGIQQQQGQVVGVQTSVGMIQGGHYVLAAGAWGNEIFPIPVKPRKGQMLSVTVPESLPELPLNRVLFGEEVYIVPRRERQIIIGATSEDVGFTPHNTPQGMQSLLQRAIRLYPELENYPISEFWWGFRPATPDELPILGTSPCENLSFATGHYRNGILLAPVTSVLIADLICGKIDPLLQAFNYSRFQNSSTSTPMFTNSVNFTNGNGKASSQPQDLTPKNLDSNLIIAGKSFKSRLMTGTGKYRSIEEMQQSIVASDCQIVTVAVRRVQTNAPGHEGLAQALDWSKIWMLPNTAGCKTAEEAVRVARLGREMAKLLGQEDNNFVKLEVIPDAKYLLPDPIGTLQAAEQLVKEGFAVLPYINADPMLAKHLEDCGCATVMPLAAPIGSGQGLKTTANIRIIIENAKIPVVVDAGIGAPSEAAEAMEYAMHLAAIAGRTAYLAGRMPRQDYAIASSPLTGTVN
jgi:thiazole synthase